MIEKPGRHSFSSKALAGSIDPRLTNDPHWPALARQLDIAYRDGADIAALTRHAAAERALPDEQPAAALHWRLVDAIAASKTKQNAEQSQATSAGEHGVVVRPLVDEPTPTQSRPRDIDCGLAFGNKPAPGRGVGR